MTQEKLMQQRYKVIADWPYMGEGYSIGKIIQIEGTDQFIKENNFYDKYPHLFKKLEWWEERGIENMPQYLRLKNQDWVFMPICYLPPVDVLCPDEVSDTFIHEIMNFIPATREEYEQYLQSKK